MNMSYCKKCYWYYKYRFHTSTTINPERCYNKHLASGDHSFPIDFALIGRCKLLDGFRPTFKKDTTRSKLRDI